MAYWIREREKIRKLKEAGKPPPWTDDSILRGYRFCNVHREDDRVTRWITKHWRRPYEHDEYLWHALLIARYLNWPPTLEAIGYPEPWGKRYREVAKTLHALHAGGLKVFTGAYIVSTNGVNMSKIAYVLDLFERAWQYGKQRPMQWCTLSHAHQWLMSINGVGSFMAAQIIADLKYTSTLSHSSDWWDWAAPGPGSLRGLSRVRGLGTGSTWRKDAFIPELLKLRVELTPLLPPGLQSLHLQDLQNCLCEFDKYERVRLGQGRPRATYTPRAVQGTLAF